VGHFAIQFAKAKGARVLTTDRKRRICALAGCRLVIDYGTQRFGDEASGVEMVLDLIDGETRERSWKLVKKGGALVSTLTEPSQEKANKFGLRATRYTVEANGSELAEIAELVTSGKVRPHVQKTFPLAADALASVESGHSLGKVV
jgi:NADPH:quinone reductase-like Zn-dependent oxidoreductase